MNVVQKIKRKYDEVAQAEMDALLTVLKADMERNVLRRREEEAQRMKQYRRHQAVKARKNKVNVALQRVGIPLRVL